MNSAGQPAATLSRGVCTLATFLDRRPYIWFWRPTYSVFGSWIKECKALITNSNEIQLQHEERFARIESAQRETSDLLEQLVVTMLGDRQVPRAIEEMRAVLASELSRHQAEAHDHHVSNIESPPSAGEIG